MLIPTAAVVVRILNDYNHHLESVSIVGLYTLLLELQNLVRRVAALLRDSANHLLAPPVVP